LIRELLLDAASSQGSPTCGELSFKDEIAALRSALQRLQESFSRVDSIEEQLKLSYAINHTTSSLARLVRTQHQIRACEPSEFNQAADWAINIVLKEKRFI
jgi:hypothetical protein